jgi:hypothetical protein
VDGVACVTRDEIRALIVQVVAETRAHQPVIEDQVVLKVVSAILTGFGINEDDRAELREDFMYLRRWRETSEHIQHGGWIAVMTVLVTGLCGALVLGVKALLGIAGH